MFEIRVRESVPEVPGETYSESTGESAFHAYGLSDCPGEAYEPDSGRIFRISVSRITPNRSQPRKVFDETAISRLADSIKRYGLLQPLSVRRLDFRSARGGGYEIIAGERRFRAAQRLGMEYVPCLVISADDRTAAELALIENIQREGLTMFEQVGAIAALTDIFKLTQEQIAQHLSASQSYVANKLRLLRLSEQERELIIEGRLTERHARALLRISDHEGRIAAAEYIIAHGFNVSDSERYIERKLCGETGEQKSCVARRKKLILRDLRLFFNTLEKAAAVLRQSGASVSLEKRQNGDGDTLIEIKVSSPMRGVGVQ